ncbi:MAG: aminodeoxychorismate/anthranilate synthase component II [Rhodospirillaceae bacterium]|jgi:anthranilate synthase component 2|nr:aminodeoxychorismate/anthranilate synthase component II [Rhodospirillaceae bacterium]MBT4589259.1 aminodeoxychorismate/anthranilate synthase component II [Rhodospirillaceae bacterium]MBT4938528.1 aminodeoxychorismate/anthranilate synthase component II [Rhodospirillaceae bacterium]MBT5938519.1 aminodeoxychorismate/anthranilate synthase component II [Rhodospirillaceae bacterium]MBT7265839.1 aminodeoxychorismate/anthranilate synthase component II [Rhodospirillaceae bacterium]
MFLLIDNYDSFTYNLWHYLGEIGVDVVVRRNDALTADEALALNPEAIIVSPGPCDPDKAGICLELVEKAAGKMPIFGVCLGYQTIGQVFGAKVVRSSLPMHGKLSQIQHNGQGIFANVAKNFQATRYHSLMLEPENWPEDIEITAKSDDGVIMAIAHKKHAIFGVQFHPESIASEHGHQLLKNFVGLVN